MNFYSILWVVFLIHLIPVGCVFCLTHFYPEAVMCWLIFLLLDFPLSWLFFTIEPVVRWVSDSQYWANLLAPAIFFQVVGCINWLIIYLIVTGCLRKFR